jgi:hypothetical protein
MMIWSGPVTVLVLLTAYYLMERPVTDGQRYAELQRLGSTYKMARTARPSFPDLIAALLHFGSFTNYLRGQFDKQEKALVSSGYLVEITVPVYDLQAKRVQVRTTLSNTWARTGAYYVATLDKTRDEIRLLCRKEDIPLWQNAFRTVQGQ